MKVGTLIIGSGVAAAVVAQRILEEDRGASVLILEAGTRVKTKDFGLWENYLITGRLPYDPYKDLPYPQRDFSGENVSAGGNEVPLAGARVFAYGGSTLHWGGWSFRLKREDFHLDAKRKEAIPWPFPYEHLEPFYCQAEEHLAVSGDSADGLLPRSKPYPFRPFPLTLEDKPFADAMDRLGVTYGNLPIARRGVSATPSRHAPCQTTGTCKYCPFGARYAACNYLDDLREWNDYPGLDVKLGAVVQTITMADKRRASGAVYWDRESGDLVTVEADRVVVAAGAIESAKLLQRSTSADWPQGVGNGADLVGRYLITHPYFMFTAQLPANPARLQAELFFPTLVSRHFDSEAEQDKGKFVLVAPPDGVGFSLAKSMQSGFSRAEVDARLAGPNTIQLHGMIEVFGEARNRVSNDTKVNHVGLPTTVVDHNKNDGEFKARMSYVQEKVVAIFDAMGASLTEKPNISWRADHAASVCRMSPDDTKGVVDENLCVHGTDNLWVISNAVFPNLGAVNPTLTLTALAFRLGDHLTGKSAT